MGNLAITLTISIFCISACSSVVNTEKPITSTNIVIKKELSSAISDTTVSLLYPPNHETKANKTIVSGMTDSTGNFIINSDFSAVINGIYIVEAVKQLETERTLLPPNGKIFHSLVTNNTNTTKGLFKKLTPDSLGVEYEK